MKKIKKMAAVIILILIAFIYGHIHKTHAIYDRTVENDQYIMLDGSQSQITQEFICEEDSLDGIQAIAHHFLQCFLKSRIPLIAKLNRKPDYGRFTDPYHFP